MALPRVFAALTSAQMSYLDEDFNAVAALTTVQSTASGTNTITLTPAANAPTVGAYGLPNPVRFGFLAGATSSGAVTLRVNALAFLKVFLPSGVQANTGDMNSGSYYEVVYLASLDSGNGGWVIASALPGTGTTPVALGSARGLVVTNNAGTPSTKIDITASKIVPVTSTGAPVFLSSFSATIDLTTSGLNGMDTGARPTNGWVYIYALSNGSLTGGIATTTSPTAGSFSPTPSGYIYSFYVGAMFLDGSQNLKRSRQAGRRAQYTVVSATNTAAYPVIGTTTSATLAALAVTSVVPLTASEITVIGSAGGASSNYVISPNNQTVAIITGGGANPAYMGVVNVGTTNQVTGTMILESTNIYGATNGGTLNVSCPGWIDYYVNA